MRHADKDALDPIFQQLNKTYHIKNPCNKIE